MERDHTENETQVKWKQKLLWEGIADEIWTE